MNLHCSELLKTHITYVRGNFVAILYSSLYIVRMIKSTRMMWLRHIIMPEIYHKYPQNFG
jgi:hypothetical protein